jgi:hypothetical protein
MLFGVIETSNAGINASKKSFFVMWMIYCLIICSICFAIFFEIDRMMVLVAIEDKESIYALRTSFR